MPYQQSSHQENKWMKLLIKACVKESEIVGEKQPRGGEKKVSTADWKGTENN